MRSARILKRREVIVRLTRDGKTIPEIAEALGISRGVVSEELNGLGLKAVRAPMSPMRVHGKDVTKADVDRERRALLAPLAARGLSTHEIADEIGVPWPKVRKILIHLGIEAVPHERFHGTTPRVASRRAVVARMVQEGKTTREISKAIGVSGGTVALDRKALGLLAKSEGALMNAHAVSGLAVSVTELLLADLTVAEVAERLRIPIAEVEAIMESFDVPGALTEFGRG